MKPYLLTGRHWFRDENLILSFNLKSFVFFFAALGTLALLSACAPAGSALERLVDAESGWVGVAGVLFPVGEGGLNVGVEGFYGQNNHMDASGTKIDGDKTNPYGAMAILEYDIGSGDGIGAYIFGGAGLLIHKCSTDGNGCADDDSAGGTSDSNFGYEAGAGVGIPVGGSTSIWVEGRYMGASGTNIFGILAGLGFGIG